MTTVVRNIIEVLISEWGVEHVRMSFFEAQDNAIISGAAKAGIAKGSQNYQKPSAVDMVVKCDVEDSKRKLLLEIAKRFDDKLFLPRLGDVRHFLEMKGEMSNTPKQRPDAFRNVLNVLRLMSSDGIERVLKDRSNSGPARLGPISKAINQAGAARNNSSRQPIESGGIMRDEVK